MHLSCPALAVARLAALLAPLLAPLLACSGDDGATAASTSKGSESTTTAATADTQETTGTTAATATETDTGTTGVEVLPLGPWRVMTFNIMCADCKPEGFEDWDLRVPHIGDTMRRADPDLLGVQELFLGEQVARIEAELGGAYSSIWFAAPDPESLDYADAAIFYRNTLFEEVERGFYWLSPTPDVAYSSGFASPQLPRMVAWARLRVRADQREFYFATTHFDNNAPSQEMSAPLVLERTAALGDALPVIMVGDFNSKTDTLAYQRLTEGVDGQPPRFDDAFVLAGAWASDSNLDPVPAYDPGQRIDHVFVTGAPWIASDWLVDLWGYGPDLHETSDHFAIAVTVAVP